MIKPKFIFPVKSNTRQSVKKISMKNLTWPQALIRFPKLNPFGDSDKDGKLNMFDCRPFDKKRQDVEDAELYLHDSHYGHLKKYGFTHKEAKKQTDKEKLKPNVDAIIDLTLGKTYIQNMKGLSEKQIADVLTHESVHNTLNKNISLEASDKFDNISLKLEDKNNKKLVTKEQKLKDIENRITTKDQLLLERMQLIKDED